MPTTPDSRGFVYLKLGQFDKAAADYDAALKIDPKIATSLFGRGVARLKTGNSAAGNADIAAAKAIKVDTVEQMAALGGFTLKWTDPFGRIPNA